jgi:hypothetical protein
MTDTGAGVARTEDPRAENPGAEATGAEPGSRFQRYRERIEELAFAIRNGAERHAPPEVLTGLAATAKNVAQYLDDMAERARVKQAKEEAAPEPTERAESASKD